MEVKERSAKYLRSGDFKQTEIGRIPNDWALESLKHISAFITKGTTPTTYGFKWETHGVLFLRSECVSENGLDLKQSMYISTVAHDTLRRSQVCDGDLLITITGNVGRIILLSGVGTANINQHIAKVRVNAPGVDSRFVHQFLLQPSVRRRFNSITTGQAYPQVSLKQVRETQVSLPPTKAEQENIAEALSDADALIESLEQLLAKKRHLKQGAMQELLTGKRRLSGFGGDWKICILRDLGATFGGLTGKRKRDFGNGVARYITFMNIMTNVVIDIEAFERVNVAPAESQNRVGRGDLFFNGSSETPEEVGMCALLSDDVRDVYLNSFCFGFRFKDGAEADGLYFAYYFRSLEGRELLKSLAQGATRYNLSKTALLNVAFPLPALDEQIGIAAILSDIDAEIAALEDKVIKARQLKHGMMQELLTGRIRMI